MKRLSAHIVSISLMAMLLMLPGCRPSRETALRQGAAAQARFEAGNLKEARRLTLAAIKDRDDIVELYQLLARIEFKGGDTGAAFGAYNQVLDLDPTHSEALAMVGDLGLQVGRLEEADKAADQMLALNPSARNALLIKGIVAIDKGRRDQAEEYANRILALAANDQGGLVLQARLMALKGDLAGALALMNKTEAESQPSEATAATKLEIYRAQGDGTNLIIMQQRLVNKMPQNFDAAIDLGYSLYKTGQIQPARDVLRALIDRAPNSAPVHQLIVRVWREFGDKTPLSAVDVAAFTAKGSPTTRIIVSRYLLEQGDVVSALSMLADPAKAPSEEARGLYLRALSASGDTAKAQPMVAALLEEDKTNTDALAVRARQEIEARQYEEAIRDAQIVIGNAPNADLGYMLLGQALEAKGEKWRIKQNYEQGLLNNPQSLALHQTYIDYLLRTDQRAVALSAARRLTKASPSSTAAWQMFSDICAGLPSSANCKTDAATGLARSRNAFRLDPQPGTPRRRGLFAPLT